MVGIGGKVLISIKRIAALYIVYTRYLSSVGIIVAVNCVFLILHFPL